MSQCSMDRVNGGLPMELLKSIFSRKNLPRLLLLSAVYLLGRMDGEGRFHWRDVFSTIWAGSISTATSAAASAKGIIGL